MRQKLVIISHTEHFLRGQQAVGWGSTITEINYLSQYWKEVVHIACLHPGKAPQSSLPYTKDNIRFEAIPPFGGTSWKDKVSIFFKMPNILRVIKKEIKDATEVQLRLPTGIGVVLLPWFSLKKRKYTFWVKYAGNWVQENPPIGYAFQLWWLKKNLAKCIVTINGKWPNQPNHCISFENPCLTTEEIKLAEPIVAEKKFSPPYKLLFIGQLVRTKGVDRILDALENIPQEKVSQIVFAGNGPDINAYRKKAEKISIECHFPGFQSREKVHDLLKESHFLLLPSDTEGFPKVVAEAATYGVISVVTEVSSIPHYINSTNGYLWQLGTSLGELLNKVLAEEENELKRKCLNVYDIAPLFTFSHFYKKLQQSILK